MDWRVTLLSLVALVGLAVYVFVFDAGSDDQRAVREASASKIFGEIEADAVDRLQLRTTDGFDAELQRAGGVWRLIRPVEVEADAVAAEELVAALGSLESDAVYDEIESLASYGLEVEPSLRFGRDGAEQALRLGDNAPVGGGRYATNAVGDRVWLVAAWRTSAFAKSLHQLREARLVRVDSADVTSLSIRWPGGEVSLVRGELGAEGAWRLQTPLAGPARDRTVEDLLSDLSFLRASAFVDDPTDAERSSFASPAYRVEIGQPGVEVPLLFELAASGEGDRTLVRGPSGLIAEISEADVGSLPRAVSDFRFRELARFVPSEVKRFSLTFSGEGALGVEGTRTEAGDWAFGEVALEPGAAARSLSALSQLEATEIAADSMGTEELAGLGLVPARVRIQVFGAESPLADLTLGAVRGDGAIAARRGDAETVYWLDAGFAQDVPISQAAFNESFRASADEPSEEAAGKATR
jgi:hypothetical protein